MAGFLSNSVSDYFTGAFYSGFLSFQNELTIYKEPLKTISNINSDSYAGYGQSSVESTITYTPVSGLYSGIVRPAGKPKGGMLVELSSRITKSSFELIIEKPARDFITNGKTELIDYQGIKYNLTTEQYTTDYLGLIFYVYGMEIIQ